MINQSLISIHIYERCHKIMSAYFYYSLFSVATTRLTLVLCGLAEFTRPTIATGSKNVVTELDLCRNVFFRSTCKLI